MEGEGYSEGVLSCLSVEVCMGLTSGRAQVQIPELQEFGYG